MNYSSEQQSLRSRLIEKAWADPSFKRSLVSQPITTIERFLGITLPNSIQVKVLEESHNTLYLVIPQSSTPEELSDLDLEMVAGGKRRRDGLIEPNWDEPPDLNPVDIDQL
jgi:hypothetical protein